MIVPNTESTNKLDEETFMCRKLGLKMKAFLLSGELSITDGVVNFGLHVF